MTAPSIDNVSTKIVPVAAANPAVWDVIRDDVKKVKIRDKDYKSYKQLNCENLLKKLKARRRKLWKILWLSMLMAFVLAFQQVIGYKLKKIFSIRLLPTTTFLGYGITVCLLGIRLSPFIVQADYLMQTTGLLILAYGVSFAIFNVLAAAIIELSDSIMLTLCLLPCPLYSNIILTFLEKSKIQFNTLTSVMIIIIGYGTYMLEPVREGERIRNLMASELNRKRIIDAYDENLIRRSTRNKLKI
ncbi:uncharacterized protein TRIADDRAFT_58464 [Trichoplax adhaerens]|uniref:Uncharacterized protein n=1 Tax=Trichoplax adhaerens TaxID=10228 RepID=B3S2S4_TRIAD|nr:predicted protein [Trichoplax adhaerens]EDV22840.1 predicted protein [Trichoplax adhaerens]|eukprot:XP_002114706.1 predicted protein [Trichoplax adhaerens]